MTTAPSNISALVIAKNESANIAACLETLSFCAEIIVIDDESTDDTADIAQSLGAKVYRRAMNNDYGAQQTFAIEKATSPWLFFIDCDERVTPALREEIISAVADFHPLAYSMRRLNFFGKKRVYFGTMRSDYVSRLMPRAGVRVVGEVHQKIEHPYPEKKLKGALLHYTYQSWAEYYAKFDRYTALSALKYHEEKRRSHFFWDIMVRPFWAFIKIYFFNLGFLDGRIGFVLAANHYFYTYTKYVRFYYLEHPLD